jgi:hypothetical protein
LRLDEGVQTMLSLRGKVGGVAKAHRTIHKEQPAALTPPRERKPDLLASAVGSEHLSALRQC